MKRSNFIQNRRIKIVSEYFVSNNWFDRLSVMGFNKADAVETQCTVATTANAINRDLSFAIV